MSFFIAQQLSSEAIHAIGQEVRNIGLVLIVVVILGAWGYQFLKNPPWGRRKSD